MKKYSSEELDEFLKSFSKALGNKRFVSFDLFIESINNSKLIINKDDFRKAINLYRLNIDKMSLRTLKTLTVIHVGDQLAKIKHAYNLIDIPKNGYIKNDQILGIFKKLGVDSDIADKITIEMSQDGDEKISIENFTNYIDKDFESHPSSYKAVSPYIKNNITTFKKDYLPKKDLKNASIETKNNLHGTSKLQMQIGLFRLIQGAAYRSFRSSYTANSETHLRAYDLPYTFNDFTIFVDSFIKFYLSLGIVDESLFYLFDEFLESVDKQKRDLVFRIDNWNKIDKTDQMKSAERNLENEIEDIAIHHQIFSYLIELVLTGDLHGKDYKSLTLDDLEYHELNRLRSIENRQELSEKASKVKTSSFDYLSTWQKVILDSTGNHYKGAIIPTSYWYEEFFPLLCKISFCTSNEDIERWDNITEEELVDWYNKSRENGSFDLYGNDIKTHFLSCSYINKKCIWHSWNLSKHYLNGIQKRRERLEFGRDSGFLSQYVTFIDIFLGRNDIESSQMRISFPYYIGPPTWRFLHTSAEIISESRNSQEEMIGLFKNFFRAFATMYPCPYCRYHLNRYVVRNREFMMYPLEYILLGSNKENFNLDININDKLSVINNGESLRLFLWKLHNTVSSSIARTEEWFHKDQDSFYTSRYWPSLDSELKRASILNHHSLKIDIISRIYSIVKSTFSLSILRDEFKNSLNNNNSDEVKRVHDKSIISVDRLNKSIKESRFLQDHYKYQPQIVDKDPHFSEEEESLSRSGNYTEEY